MPSITNRTNFPPSKAGSGNKLVTPKEIDELIDNMSSIVSDVINEII